MNVQRVPGKSPRANGTRAVGFTLIELLIVIAIVAVVAAILLPALSKARARAEGMLCVSNTRQLALAWQLYANDYEGRLAYNLGMSGSSFRTSANWVNNVMTWDLSSDNTNLATITGASLGPFVGATAVYHCPADHALSGSQYAAGWNARIRSYSMNAMVGNAGDLSTNGVNANDPDYTQFFKITQIPQPSEIFVFLDEHPDSINDGYFVERDYYPEWHDLPASYHNGSAAFSFADGHSSLHRWLQANTIIPPVPDAANLPIAITSTNLDFDWVIHHMSVEQN